MISLLERVETNFRFLHAVLSDGNLTYGRPVVSIRKIDAEGPLQDISLSRLVVIFRRGVENRIPVFPSTASLRDINTNG